LANLQNPSQAQNKHLICAILNIAHSLPYPIHFHWIPGHHGHVGNELADTTAKNATSSQTVPLICPIQFSSPQIINDSLKKGLLSQLKQNWDNIAMERPMVREFFTSYNQFQNFLKNSHKYPLLNGVITDHLPTHAHLYRMNLTTGPACPICLDLDDKNHFWFECIRYSSQRRDLCKMLQISLSNFNWQIIQNAISQAHFPTLTALNAFLENTIYKGKRVHGDHC
jgi:RNase H